MANEQKLVAPPHISQLIESYVASRLYWVEKKGAWTQQTVDWITKEWLTGWCGGNGSNWPPTPLPKPPKPPRPAQSWDPPQCVLDDLMANLKDPRRSDLSEVPNDATSDKPQPTC